MTRDVDVEVRIQTGIAGDAPASRTTAIRANTVFFSSRLLWYAMLRYTTGCYGAESNAQSIQVRIV